MDLIHYNLDAIYESFAKSPFYEAKIYKQIFIVRLPPGGISGIYMHP
jgi:hypothetical protein